VCRANNRAIAIDCVAGSLFLHVLHVTRRDSLHFRMGHVGIGESRSARCSVIEWGGHLDLSRQVRIACLRSRRMIAQRFFFAELFCARLLRRLKTARSRFRSLFFSAAAVSLDTNMSLFPITTRT
jgi:hypothetical protein